MKGQKCKDCKAPIYSATEKARGVCTACAYKQRQNRSHLQKPTVDKEAASTGNNSMLTSKGTDLQKPRKPQSRKGSVLTSPAQDKGSTLTSKGTTFQGPSSELVATRIPKQAKIVLQNEAELAGMTLSTYLRDLILGAITVRNAAQVASKRV